VRTEGRACGLSDASRRTSGLQAVGHGIAPLHDAIAHLAEGQSWAVSVLLENGANALAGVMAVQRLGQTGE